jgi:Cu/Ag efflux protein CusF
MRKLVATLASLALCFAFTASAWACDTSSGEVLKIDTKANRLIMAKSAGCGDSSGCGSEMTFTLAKGTKVLINGKAATLADLKTGDKVKVDYEKLDDVLAVSVTREG